MTAFSPISQASFQIHGSFNLFNSLLQSDLDDKELRLLGWNDLKLKAPIGPLNIPKMMQEIEQEALNNGKPLVDNVNELFEKFAARLAPEFEVAQVPAAHRQVTELQINALQERLRVHYENTALETMWNACLHRQFHDQGAFAQEAPPSSHQAIREWLNNPVNLPRIQQIRFFEPTGLGLIGLRLRALPPEIGLFTGLTFLNLSGNQLSFLPDSFGNLQALEWLNLSGNQLSFLPDSFGNFQALKYLDLSQNQLSFLPDSFGSLKTLNELFLNQNRLSFLPDSFGSLKALHHLSLENNQLRNLPDSFGGLQTLHHLYLNNNQLSSLPDFLGGLPLRCLRLFNNQLSFLPESFCNLSALNWLDLNANPLMLVSDKERDKIRNYQTYLAQLESLKKYAPQSPLATLFHAIIFNKPAETIQQAYAQLSPEMQQRIAALASQDPTHSGSAQRAATSSSSDLSSAQGDLFTDKELFARSVRKATYDLYYWLGQEQKTLVHYHIWDLAGKPETDDSNWGQHHVFDHVLRFTDALERATQN